MRISPSRLQLQQLYRSLGSRTLERMVMGGGLIPDARAAVIQELRRRDVLPERARKKGATSSHKGGLSPMRPAGSADPCASRTISTVSPGPMKD